MRFSKRYGYEKPSDVIIKEKITPEIVSTISNCYIDLLRLLTPSKFRQLEISIKRYFLNQSLVNIPQVSHLEGKSGLGYTPYNHHVIIPYLEDSRNFWWQKLDLIEYTIDYSKEKGYQNEIKKFIYSINSEFERLNFAYRIVDYFVVDISSEQEIKSIETSINDSSDNIAMHLKEALRLYSHKESPALFNGGRTFLYARSDLIAVICVKCVWRHLRAGAYKRFHP